MSVQRLSRRVAHALRHDRELSMTPDGWVTVTDVLHHLHIDRADLNEVMAASERYETDTHGLRIRARYGHSVDVKPVGDPSLPPSVLFHGTAWSNLDGIFRDGLRPMNRQHVHLHADRERALDRGPALLEVDTRRASDGGCRFYDSDAGVWLTEHVPVEFLTRAG